MLCIFAGRCVFKRGDNFFVKELGETVVIPADTGEPAGDSVETYDVICEFLKFCHAFNWCNGDSDHNILYALCTERCDGCLHCEPGRKPIVDDDRGCRGIDRWCMGFVQLSSARSFRLLLGLFTVEPRSIDDASFITFDNRAVFSNCRDGIFFGKWMTDFAHDENAEWCIKYISNHAGNRNSTARKGVDDNAPAPKSGQRAGKLFSCGKAITEARHMFWRTSHPHPRQADLFMVVGTSDDREGTVELFQEEDVCQVVRGSHRRDGHEHVCLLLDVV